MKGEAACSEGRAETSEDEGVHRCCQPCRSFAEGLAAVLLEEMGCLGRGPVDGRALPKLERCPVNQLGRLRGAEKQRPGASQRSVGRDPEEPGQCNSHASTHQ